MGEVYRTVVRCGGWRREAARERAQARRIGPGHGPGNGNGHGNGHGHGKRNGNGTGNGNGNGNGHVTLGALVEDPVVGKSRWAHRRNGPSCGG